MPGAAVLAPLAFIFANLLIYWSGFEVLWKLGIAIVVGYVLIGIFMYFDTAAAAARLEVRAAGCRCT